MTIPLSMTQTLTGFLFTFHQVNAAATSYGHQRIVTIAIIVDAVDSLWELTQVTGGIECSPVNDPGHIHVRSSTDNVLLAQPLTAVQQTVIHGFWGDIFYFLCTSKVPNL